MGLVKHLFSFMAVGLLGLIGTSFSSNSVNDSKEIRPLETSRLAANSVYPDPASVELTSEDLSVNITSSTTTESSQAYQVVFSSSIILYTNQYKNVYITITDPSFTSEGDYPATGSAEGLPVFEAMVYTIKNPSTKAKDIVIPRYLRSGTSFNMHVTGFYRSNVVEDYKSISSILVHNDLSSMPVNTFVGVPDATTIKCMDAAPKDNWPSDWCDAKNITYSYEPTDSDTKALENLPRSGASATVGTGKNFLIGYYGEDDYYLPLVILYTVKKDDGTTESRYQELALSSVNSIYDGVGESLGSSSTSKAIDIALAEGEKIDETSISFCNIHEYTQDADMKIIPDLTKPTYQIKASLSFSGTYDISDFITYRQGKASTYAGYTQVDLNIDKVPGVYERIKADSYANNKTEIDKGNLTIRYRLTSLSSGSYRIKYKKDGGSETTSVNIETPVDYVILSSDKNNEVGFILKDEIHTDNTDAKDVDYNFGGFKNIETMDYVGMYITLDLFKSSNGSIVTKSSISIRFGLVPMIKDTNLSSFTNINMVIILASIIYALVFAAGDVAYYFYKKNRFKNDEFRRVKPKQFIKHSIINGVGFGLILLSVLYIIARFNIMNTSVVAYNPLDVYVIVFTVAGAIFLGIAIKDAVFSIRDNKERKRAIKLHLGNDVVDDGTGTK